MTKFMDAAKANLREKYIVISAYIKEKKPQVNNLSLQFKKLKKEEENKVNVNRKKETIKTRGEINEIEYKKK